MKYSLHDYFSQSFLWYKNWHEHPGHQYMHWSVFVVMAILVFSLSVPSPSQDFTFEPTIVHAQAGPTLGISRDRFTLNGTPQFLLFISYFDAMAASPTTLDSDFARLNSLEFDGVRIFPNWNPADNQYRLMDASGNLRAGRLAALQNIIQIAGNNGLVVDVSFTRDTVTGLSVAEYQNGIVATTQGLTAHRNLFFDLQNEADHPNNDRVNATEARSIRDAVKAVDPGRIVSVSLISGSTNPTFMVNGGMDFALVHGPFGTLAGTRTLVAQAQSSYPGMAIHMQEPNRCRDSNCGGQVSSNFFTAAQDAKCSGAAGWNFHTPGGYELANSTLFSWGHAQDSPAIEQAVADGLASALAGTTWNSCGTGGPGGTNTGGPPYGTQGNCPTGYIMLGEANASIGDPTATGGYFCDEDAAFDRGANPSVTELQYPVTGRLYCGSVGSGTAFAVNGQTPCNLREISQNWPTGWPGWEFRSSRPYLRGSAVNLVGEHACDDPGYTEINVSSSINYGAWTNNAGGMQGYFCVVGTDLSLVDPPVIYYVFPGQVQNGGTLLISGKNLVDTVEITDVNGGVSTFTGTLNSSATEISLALPSLISGYYALSVGTGSSMSNPLPFEVLPGTFVQGPSATAPPIITLINPTVVSQGSTFLIVGRSLTPNVQFFGANGIPINLTGVINSDVTTTTVSVPFGISPGIYTIGITGPFGSTVAQDIVTVTGSQVPPAPGAQSIPPPAAQSFGSLISSAFDYAVMFVGIAVFIMILWAGFLWLTSAANPGNIARAKDMIKNAIIGAILLLSAYAILYTINPELVGGDFNLPGIEVPIGPGPGTGNPSQGPAARLMNASGVTFSTDADCGGSYHALQNIRDMANGLLPAVCTSSLAGGTGTGSCNPCIAGGTSGNINIDPILLEILYDLSQQGTSFTVTSLSTGNHSANSTHYSGRAVDIDLTSNNSADWIAARNYLNGRGGGITAFCETGSGSSDAACNLPPTDHIHISR